jgi:hypothetical protein
MYWLIEDEEQLQTFNSLNYKEAFIEIIPFNDNIHPTQNEISLIYIRPLLSPKGFMLGINHSETLNEINQPIRTILNKFSKLYCRDKKETLHYLPLNALFDITSPPHPYIRPNTPTHTFYYNKYPSLHNINSIIPIVKHYEVCEHMYQDLLPNINKELTKFNNFFNTKTSLVFSHIERNGIKIDKEKFENYFHPSDNNFVYTQYNIKTLTTRPSNTFNGVNYAALNKENGCRESFIPQNDYFIEIDINGMHPSILSLLINYKIEGDDIHQYLANLYNTSREEGKKITFKQINGGIYSQYQDVKFFKLVKQYTDNLWEQFNKDGYIVVPYSNYIIDKNVIKDANPQKLLNYLLQSLETTINVLVLWDVIKNIINLRSKIRLYVYDSLLIDIIDEEKDNVLNAIESAYKKWGMNTHIKTGNNYNNIR